MRQLIVIALFLVTPNLASAQAYQYAEQTYQPPQTAPQQVSGNYYAPPVYVVQPGQAPTQQQHQAPQPAPARQPQPWDAGQSVTTDIRQMNF